MDICTGSDDAIIITAILALAQSLQYRDIAEGVEPEDQYSFLFFADDIMKKIFNSSSPFHVSTYFLKSFK